MNGKIAFTVNELAQTGPIGRTKLFEEIRNGKLPAKKVGSRTIVLREDFESFLRGLPTASPGAPAKPPKHS